MKITTVIPRLVLDRRHQISCLVLAVLVINGRVHAQNADLDTALLLLPHVTFEQIETADGFVATYELRIRQPIDHQNPDRGSFFQRAFLNHRDFDRPTVLVTNGYGREGNRVSEPSHYLDANELSVEHRYFGVSIPDSVDWSFLTLEQATADLHRARTTLGEAYVGPWVATGRSKGGMTTVAYRYFFPDDVAASIPYVAPLQSSTEDERIYEFLRSAGPPECRAQHLRLQRWVLAEKEQFLPKMLWFAKGKAWTYEYMGSDAALEYAVLEYPFSFWQYGWECDQIPDIDAWPNAVDETLEHLDEVVGLSMYSDQGIESLGPHYYQAATQTGYYGFETEPFADLLSALTDEPNAAFPPKRFEIVYDSTLLVQITEWAETEADEIVYIYGAVDTWTAAAVYPAANLNSLCFVTPGRHHGDATIENLLPENKERMRVALEEWLGVTLDAEVWQGR